ncbi:hypothetical protein EDF56_101149 [Novosphingobium sp. PhB165]|uniref:hypothetical protein n=1 Tax=Novosphingobium sp. PhB165 TaxID=2485105 RepID=UPI0010494D84|nr:hypothetical protein [Novosphingobium sp. PhB165]TCM21485.1 hypothetical protein EDF56_101149 [Novosphingobium sp. PhB165]
MTKTSVLGSHTSSLRDSWWYLEQDADGSIFVRHEDDEDSSKNWRKPLHEVMAGNGSAKKLVQERIDRMFEDRTTK